MKNSILFSWMQPGFVRTHFWVKLVSFAVCFLDDSIGSNVRGLHSLLRRTLWLQLKFIACVHKQTDLLDFLHSKSMQSAVLKDNGMALLQERRSVKQFLSEELCYMSKCGLLRKEFNCSLLIYELNRKWSISDSNQPTILSISTHFLWQCKVDSLWPRTDLAQMNVVLGETLQSPSFPPKQMLVVSFTFSFWLPKWQNCS